MAYLSPPTLTRAEQEALLRVSASHPRDHLIFSLALGTGLRLAEIVGLNVGDVFFPNGTPRTRVRLRREIAKGGRFQMLCCPASEILGLQTGNGRVSTRSGLVRGIYSWR